MRAFHPAGCGNGAAGRRLRTIIGWLAWASSSCLSAAVQDGGLNPAFSGSNSLQWPPPPAPARISHLQNIACAADLGIKPSSWSRLSRFFTGASRDTEKFMTPSAVAFDEEGNICLTDTGTAQVWFFDCRRKRHERWEKIAKTRFVLPVAVAKRHGVLYVSDSGLGKILAFDGKGKLRFEIASPIERPAGLVITEERLFVADAAAHRITAFDLQGRFLFHIGRRGAAPGEFNFPTHLAADGKGRLLVTDSMNARVQVFNRQGEVQNVISSRGDGSGHLSRPKGLALDREGHLFIVDAVFDNFQVFDQEGRFLLDVGGSGSGAGEFWLPAGIAISDGGKVVVADSYNHRLQSFQLVSQP